MKKIVKILALLLLIALFNSVTAYGKENGFDFSLEEQLDIIGADQLEDKVSDEANEILQQMDLQHIDIGKLLSLTPGQFLEVIKGLFLKELYKPVRTLCTIAAVILLCALLNGLQDSFQNTGINSVCSMVGVVCIVTAISNPIIECIRQVSQSIQVSGDFMISFIPLFSGIVTASGQPVTATTYSMFLFGACQAVSRVVTTVLVPLLIIYFVFCLVGSILSNLDIQAAASTVKAVVTWSLTFLVTLFVGLLSIQTMVSAGADSATLKASKFLMGSFIPVIGNALSDAFTAAQGCLKLLKTAVGGYGILVALFTFLPIFFQVVIWNLTCKICSVLADMMRCKEVGGVLKAASFTLNILLSVVVCFALLLIVTTTIILTVGMGY